MRKKHLKIDSAELEKDVCCENLKFSVYEKIVAKTTFHGGVLIGVIGLYPINPIISLSFLVYSYVGILTFMRYTACPRCPHLLKGNDCVQLNPKLTKRIISNRKGPLNLLEKIIAVTVLYGILIIPIYWLLSNVLFLILFLIVYGGCLLFLNFYLCKSCENKYCILNKNIRVKKSSRVS